MNTGSLLNNKVFDYAAIASRIRDERRKLTLPHGGTVVDRNDLAFYIKVKCDQGEEGFHRIGSATIQKLESMDPALPASLQIFENISMGQWKTLCMVFHCSLEYLWGWQECRNASTQQIHDMTGLSETAIEILRQIHTQESAIRSAKLKPEGFIETLSILIESKNFKELMDLMMKRLLSSQYSEVVPKKASYTIQEFFEAQITKRPHTAKVTLPDGTPDSVPVSEYWEDRITKLLMKMLPEMKDTFKARFPDGINVANNDYYVSLSNMMGNDCLTFIQDKKEEASPKD